MRGIGSSQVLLDIDFCDDKGSEKVVPHDTGAALNRSVIIYLPTEANSHLVRVFLGSLTFDVADLSCNDEGDLFLFITGPSHV